MSCLAAALACSLLVHDADARYFGGYDRCAYNGGVYDKVHGCVYRGNPNYNTVVVKRPAARPARPRHVNTWVVANPGAGYYGYHGGAAAAGYAGGYVGGTLDTLDDLDDLDTLDTLDTLDDVLEK